MSISTILIRSIGLGATAITAYNINQDAKERAVLKTRYQIGSDMERLLLTHTANSDGNALTEKMKQGYFNWRLDDPYIPKIQYTKNKISAYFENTMQRIIPLTLGIAAMCCYNPSKIKLFKGFIPRPIAGLCAIGSIVAGLSSIKRNVFGWNSSPPRGF